MKRVKITFAGVQFTGFAHSVSHVTVPRPAFLKILKSGNVNTALTYDIESDGNGQHDRFGESLPPEDLAKRLERSPSKPWLLYLEPDKGILHYCLHRDLSYQITEGSSCSAR